MDLKKIGKFIAELRKEQGLTQEQLGEKIGVTNKTISRWETGTYLPPADALIIMSELFSLSINEILSGRRLNYEEYRQEAEKNLTQSIRESNFSLKDRIDFYKKKWLKEHTGIMCVSGVCITAVFIIGMLFKLSILLIIYPFLLIAAHCWRNNAMMAYVEKKAFNGAAANKLPDKFCS